MQPWQHPLILNPPPPPKPEERNLFSIWLSLLHSVILYVVLLSCILQGKVWNKDIKKKHNVSSVYPEAFCIIFGWIWQNNKQRARAKHKVVPEGSVPSFSWPLSLLFSWKKNFFRFSLFVTTYAYTGIIIFVWFISSRLLGFGNSSRQSLKCFVCC